MADESIVLNLAGSSGYGASYENFGNFKTSKKPTKSHQKTVVRLSKKKQISPKTSGQFSEVKKRSSTAIQRTAIEKPKRPSAPNKNLPAPIKPKSPAAAYQEPLKKTKSKRPLSNGGSSEKPKPKRPSSSQELSNISGSKIGKKRHLAETVLDRPEKSSESISAPKKKFKRLEKLEAKVGTALTVAEESEKKRAGSKIKVEGREDDVFTADRFSSVEGLHQRLVERLEREDGFGFARMAAIQKVAIPKLLAGRDCFVKSQTGSGKTLAYAVPCVQKLSEIEPRIQRQDGPYAIVLTPTRELAVQTYEVFERLLKAFIWIVPGYIAGGEKRKSEKARLRKGINVLVCTPGRLTDHLRQTSCLSLDRVRWMIYDEADRLLDGGFEQDIKYIIEGLRQTARGQCQSVLLSATLNKSVSQLADLALTDPVFVTPSATDSGTSPGSLDVANDEFVLPATLKQSYIVMPAKQRLLTLIALILSKFKTDSDDPCKKMLVFLATQDAVDFHYYLLDHIINAGLSNDDEDVDRVRKQKRFRKAEDEDGQKFNLEIYRLHGNMSQQERTAVYKEFSTAKQALLLATDVAARGLHIPRLDCIVQYNTPGVAAEYVHRVGRTARMGKTGTAILFLLPSEMAYVDMLKEYKIRMHETRQSEFMDSLTQEARVNHLPEALHEFQNRCEEFVYSREDVYEMATKAFTSFVRAYTTYPGPLKSIFNVRALHLGHLAKCFALKETPTQLASFRAGGGDRRPQLMEQFRNRYDDRNSRGRDKSHDSFKRRRPADMSEYGSGFDSIPYL